MNQTNRGPEPTEDLNAQETDAAWAGLERDLTLAMRPCELPEGFADRVLQRAGAEDAVAASPATVKTSGKLLRWPVQKGWLGGAIAAGLLVGLFAGGTALERRHADELQAAKATAQFETAERITDHAMEQAREQVERAGVDLDD